MSSILDSKKLAKLVIKTGESTYEKINPETLASIVEDTTNTTIETPKNVQDHIDNGDIHQTQVEIETNLTNKTDDLLNFTRKGNIISGDNITIDRTDGKVKISTTIPDVNQFLTKDDIIATDGLKKETIDGDKTITLKPDYVTLTTNLRNNSKVLVKGDIKAGNGVKITPDPMNNNLTISSDITNLYSAGNGIDISDDNVISNIKPDQTVVLSSADDSVTVSGTYPNFDLKARPATLIEEWKQNYKYFVNDIAIYNNALFECLIEHTSTTEFPPVESGIWKMLAGWTGRREYFTDDTIIDVVDGEGKLVGSKIVLNEEVPNKEVLIINMSGSVVQSQNYYVEPDNKTIYFKQPIPKGNVVEVIIMSNVVLSTFDTGANITDWKPNLAFAIGNLCIHLNGIYKCKEQHISTDNFDPIKWEILCGYIKETIFVQNSTPTTSVIIDELYAKYIVNKHSIGVNVGNTVLQSNCYDWVDATNTLTFVDEIEPNALIEITIYGNTILEQAEVPSPVGNSLKYMRSNASGSAYELKSVNEVATDLSIDKIITYTNNDKKYIRANEADNKVEYATHNQTCVDLQTRNHTIGLLGIISEQVLPIPQSLKPYFNDANDIITISSGGILSNDKTTFIETVTETVINPNFEFGNGGSMLEYDDAVWKQPVMTSARTPIGLVETTLEQTAREGWRAMDGLPIGSGNGWLANDTTASWSFMPSDWQNNPTEFKVISFDFYNQGSGVSNRSRDVDVWFNTPTNIVYSFTAVNADYGKSTVNIPIEKQVYCNKFGLTIKNSYGSAVGMNEIYINARYKSYIVPNQSYNAFIISDDNGENVKIVSSKNNIPMITAPYTKWARIGTFTSKGDYHLDDVFPKKDLGDSFITGSLEGVMNNNVITTYVNKDDKPIKITEQWGLSIPLNNVVTFTKPFKEIPYYVMVNGYKATNITNTGFTVNTTESVNWVAKGY